LLSSCQKIRTLNSLGRPHQEIIKTTENKKQRPLVFIQKNTKDKMKISELIKVLEDLKKQEGDLNIKKDSYGQIYDSHPKIAYIYHQTDKRSRAPRF
jgi:hypothetical protein